MRHNNVSDKENAFNRLVALFICKLVDEIKKQDFEEVDFQYKQGTDTYETLQDRLQKLHQQGMEEFMREKIVYVEADYAERLFLQYTGRQRKAAIEDLKRTIRILKLREFGIRSLCDKPAIVNDVNIHRRFLGQKVGRNESCNQV